MALIQMGGKTYSVLSLKCADALCFDAYTDKHGNHTCLTRHHRGCPMAWKCPSPCSTAHPHVKEACTHCKAEKPVSP